MNSSELRVVTVAFNPGDELATWAHSVRLATRRELDLVIVDNGTETSIVDSVASAYGARVLRPGVNLGYGSAANLGIFDGDYAGEWAMVVNPDVVFLPGSIDALIDATVDWPRGAVFGPMIRDLEGDIYPSARRFPRLVSGGGHALLANVWPDNPFSKTYRATTDTTSTHAVDWLSGACLLVRVSAFSTIGGFDDSYFMFFEDTQLGEDMCRAGWESVYVPSAEVLHEQGASWKSRPERMIRAHHRSAAHYLDGVYSSPVQAPLRYALRAGLRMRAEIQARASRDY